jgi:hypothetical protein
MYLNNLNYIIKIHMALILQKKLVFKQNSNKKIKLGQVSHVH